MIMLFIELDPETRTFLITLPFHLQFQKFSSHEKDYSGNGSKNTMYVLSIEKLSEECDTEYHVKKNIL